VAVLVAHAAFFAFLCALAFMWGGMLLVNGLGNEGGPRQLGLAFLLLVLGASGTLLFTLLQLWNL
jgi:hypothetical protein